MGICTAIVTGRRGECLRPVTEDAPLKLCLVHALLAHQWVVALGGARKVAEIIRREGQ